MISGYVDLAMKTALGLRDYEDVLDAGDIYSLLGELVNLSTEYLK